MAFLFCQIFYYIKIAYFNFFNSIIINNLESKVNIVLFKLLFLAMKSENIFLIFFTLLLVATNFIIFKPKFILILDFILTICLLLD